MFRGLLAQSPPSLAIHRPSNATLSVDGGILTLPLACWLMAEIRLTATRTVLLEAGAITGLAAGSDGARRCGGLEAGGGMGGEVRGIEVTEAGGGSAGA